MQGGIIFPSPLVPVDVYGAWLLGDWLYVIDPKKVSASFFGVDGRRVFIAENDGDRTIGFLPAGWEVFKFDTDGYGIITLIGPYSAVAEARVRQKKADRESREFSHAIFDDDARAKFQVDSVLMTGKAATP